MPAGAAAGLAAVAALVLDGQMAVTDAGVVADHFGDNIIIDFFALGEIIDDVGKNYF